MKVFVLIMSMLLSISAGFKIHNRITEPQSNSTQKFFSRSDWGARSPKEETPLHLPVPFVVIHHSYTPAACNDTEECFRAMRSMQDYHMDGHGWWDIGYNFAVGSDGAVYEGRGWRTLGAHALHFNTISIGICLIGDWSKSPPPSRQLRAAKSLIRSGILNDFLRKDFKIIGHRQVRDTECPGEGLFGEIRKWPRFSAFPASVTDLPNVVELPDGVKEILSNRIKTD